MSYPWSTGDQLNAADLDQIALSNLVQLTAAESIAANAAVAFGYFQSDGGILFDAKVTASQSTTSFSTAITIGSNSNRILIVVLTQIGNASIASVQFNGSALTQLDTGDPGSTNTYVGYILAPTTGTHNLTATIGSGATATLMAAYSYYNVAQTSTIDAHNLATALSASTQTQTASIGNVGDLVFQYLAFTSNSGSPSWSLSSPNNGATAGSTNNVVLAADNGQATNTASQVLTYTGNNAGGNPGLVYGYIVLKPATAAVYQYAVNANSGNTFTPPASTKFRSIAFAGFAVTGVSATQALIVVTSGVMGGFSGLTPLADYFLNDTNGTIGTSPGTNTRKVGIAVDATHLLVTNTW